jgi:hypothetical protein
MPSSQVAERKRLVSKRLHGGTGDEHTYTPAWTDFVAPGPTYPYVPACASGVQCHRPV